MENGDLSEGLAMLELRRSAPIHTNPLEVRTVLSFDFLLEFWKEEERENRHGLSEMARELNRKVAECPEISGAITDLSVLARHEKLMRALLSAVLPIGLTNLAFAAIAPPASWNFLHMTPRFARELTDEDGQIRGCLLLDGLDWDYMRTLFSYLLIVRSLYNVHLPFERSVLLGNEHSETGLLRTYQMRAQFDMLRVRPVAELPRIDVEAVRSLGARMTSLEAWRELVPADKFEVYGFVVYHATDVSEESNRSRLKEILVLPDPLVDSQAFSSIRDLLRSSLELPRLQFSVIGIEGDAAICLDGVQGIRNDPDETLDSFICESCRSELFQGEKVIHLDMRETQMCSPYLRELRDGGARSLLQLPLRNGRDLIGSLVLTTDQPGELTSLTQLKLEGVTELFALALARTLADAHAKIQSVMKEKFTAIHPSVEWKFRAAAMHYLRHNEIGDVVFPEAYSLYSSSDIRSSSTIRNAAIRKDLVQQIRTARSVLELAAERSQIDYLSSLIFRLDKMISQLEKGVRSGDESRIARLLASEIEPVFESLEKFGPGVHDSVEGYRTAVCSDSGDLFQERRAYDESVDILTHRLTELLTERQALAQKTFPHLFEMYRTDGVEHTIYVGNSLTERDDFSKLYLKELRLWQLRTVCMLAQLSVELESQTPHPLKVAHLILAQSDPVGLRYSQEEKTFNVDGAYNTSYEIIKKRIDKTHIKGTEERLTQPGKIALVYTQNPEAEEYRLFFDYLQQQGFLKAGIESLELEDLQGVYGLKALRVAVEV
jgi:hypothetical protein